MSTILAPGARRSAAPKVTMIAPQQSQALISDEELLAMLLPTPANGDSVATSAGNGSLSEAIGSGSSLASGPGNARGTQGTALGLSALGQLTGTPELGMMGAGISAADAAARGNYGPAATLGLSLAGVPNAGIATSIAKGDITSILNSALSAANPMLGLTNAALGMFGKSSLGDAVAPAASLGLNNLTEIAQIAIGSLMNAMSQPNANPDNVPVTDLSTYSQEAADGSTGTSGAPDFSSTYDGNTAAESDTGYA